MTSLTQAELDEWRKLFHEDVNWKCRVEAGAIFMRLIAEVERLRRSGDKWNGCPCRHTEPCSPQCTCVNGDSSAGCSRCATYRSPEQQRHAAERLARIAECEKETP